MFTLVKQVFIALLSFAGSLPTKCVPLNGESCMIRPTVINLILVQLNYYPFTVSLDICNGRCSAVHDLSTKIYVQSEKKHLINMRTRINYIKKIGKTYSV